MPRISLRPASENKQPKYIWIVFVEDSVWGVFSSGKKAHKAITAWKQSPATFGQIRAYQLNWRLHNAPAKYVSDKILPNMGGTDTTHYWNTSDNNKLPNPTDPAK